LDWPVGVERAQAADENGHLGSGEGEQVGLVHEQIGRVVLVSFAEVVAEAVCDRLQWAKECASVCSCEASVRPGAKGTLTSWPAFFAASSTAALPPRTMRSASETFLPPGLPLEPVEVLLDRFERLKDLGEFGRLVDFPILLRLEANACAVGSAALVAAAEG
jgi:hypothetical protein